MKSLTLLAAVTLVAVASHTAAAQVPINQTQDVTITVNQVDAFTINNTPITQAVGLGLLSFSGGTYNIQTNAPTGSPRSISAEITSGGSFPSALNFTVELQAPTGATSAGAVSIFSGSSTSLVTAIHNIDNVSRTITFTTAATAQVNAGAVGTRTITYTLQ